MTVGHKTRQRPGIQGAITLWDYHERTKQLTKLCSRPNQIQTPYGFAAAMTLGMGDPNYRIRAFYVEFANVADPGDVVTAPAYEEDEGLEYFNDLAFSGDQDFLRVPLLQKPMLSIADGYEDVFAENVSGNKLTFFTMTSGTVGIHGKQFSHAVNSKIFGLSLVATPVVGDRSMDVVCARVYLDPDEQVLKQASHQAGLTWEWTFLRGADA